MDITEEQTELHLRPSIVRIDLNGEHRLSFVQYWEQADRADCNSKVFYHFPVYSTDVEVELKSDSDYIYYALDKELLRNQVTQACFNGLINQKDKND